MKTWLRKLRGILGIGAVGLTQFVIWAVVMAAISAPGAVGPT